MRVMITNDKWVANLREILNRGSMFERIKGLFFRKSRRISKLEDSIAHAHAQIKLLFLELDDVNNMVKHTTSQFDHVLLSDGYWDGCDNHDAARQKLRNAGYSFYYADRRNRQVWVKRPADCRLVSGEKRYRDLKDEGF